MDNWKYDYLVEQLHRTAYKKHECFILSALFHDSRLQELKPITQYHVRLSDKSYALLDLYYPQLNIAVEVDEPHHNKGLVRDSLRQGQVEALSGCAFERIRIDQGNPAAQLERLKATLLKKIGEVKNNSKWRHWTRPPVLDINTAKARYTRTLFVKIRGVIPEEELFSRQTGYWPIAKNKTDRIERVVVVHDDVVSAVFEHPVWWETKVQTKKRGTQIRRGYSGLQVIDSPLLENHITGWTTRNTITYSRDV